MGDANRELVQRFMDAHVRKEREVGARLLHPDYVLSWPQSGEIIRGASNWRAIFENYPEDDRAVVPARRILGSEDRWAMTPSFTMTRITGEGDTYTHEGTVQYPDGELWHYVAILEILDGKIWEGEGPFRAALRISSVAESVGRENDLTSDASSTQCNQNRPKVLKRCCVTRFENEATCVGRPNEAFVVEADG